MKNIIILIIISACIALGVGQVWEPSNDTIVVIKEKASAIMSIFSNNTDNATTKSDTSTKGGTSAVATGGNSTGGNSTGGNSTGGNSTGGVSTGDTTENGTASDTPTQDRGDIIRIPDEYTPKAGETMSGAQQIYLNIIQSNSNSSN